MEQHDAKLCLKHARIAEITLLLLQTEEWPRLSQHTKGEFTPKSQHFISVQKLTTCNLVYQSAVCSGIVRQNICI